MCVSLRAAKGFRQFKNKIRAAFSELGDGRDSVDSNVFGKTLGNNADTVVLVEICACGPYVSKKKKK